MEDDKNNLTRQDMTPKGRRTKIIWDDSHIRSFNANAAHVTGTREEIALLFGESHPGQTDSKEIRVQFKEQIILGPIAAKHLAVLLNKSIQEYESRFGLLEAESLLPAEPEHRPSQQPPFSKAGSRHEKAEVLLQLVGNLNIQYGFERSFKIFEKTLLGNRFLLGFKKNSIAQKPHAKILDICRRIDMPETFLETFQENLPEANIVLFGFEENEKSCVCKAYLEFGAKLDKLIKDNPDRPEPFLMHLGFKWDASDNTRRAVARYTCFPAFSDQDMLQRLSNVFYSHNHRTPFEIAESVLNLALTRAGADEFIYFEAQEENNPRRSFDINMYKANLRLTELYPLLLKMCRHYAVSSEIFHSLYDPVKTQIFGHLTGGIDREGRDFLTVYFGEKGSSR